MDLVRRSIDAPESQQQLKDYKKIRMLRMATSQIDHPVLMGSSSGQSLCAAE